MIIIASEEKLKVVRQKKIGHKNGILLNRRKNEKGAFYVGNGSYIVGCSQGCCGQIEYAFLRYVYVHNREIFHNREMAFFSKFLPQNFNMYDNSKLLKWHISHVVIE